MAKETMKKHAKSMRNAIPSGDFGRFQGRGVAFEAFSKELGATVSLWRGVEELRALLKREGVAVLDKEEAEFRLPTAAKGVLRCSK